MRAVCEVEPVSIATHDRALEVAERYGNSIYNATNRRFSPWRLRCELFTPKTFRNGQVIENLTIRNLFCPELFASSRLTITMALAISGPSLLTLI